MGKILVSIIIPIYKVEKYIHKALNSIINQTLKEIEIICINDCTPDNSFEIVKDFASKDNRFVLIENKKNLGQGIARNQGLDIAQGEYIGFIDPDDWVELNMFEELYKIAQKEQADIVSSNFIRHFETKETKKISLNGMLKYSKIYPNTSFTYRDIKKDCLANIFHGQCFRIYNRNLINKNKIRFSSGKMGEDRCFTIGCLLSANKIFFTDKYYYHYRKHPESSSNTILINSKDIYNNLEKTIKNLKKEKEFIQELEDYKITLFLEEYENSNKHGKRKLDIYLKNNLTYLQYLTFKKRIYKIKKQKFLQSIFSIKNTKNKSSKCITILGIKFYIKKVKKNKN